MSDTEITFTGTYTCTHHTACPVCLVTALTAERERAERYRLATLKLDAELASEREKVRVLREALSDAQNAALPWREWPWTEGAK